MDGVSMAVFCYVMVATVASWVGYGYFAIDRLLVCGWAFATPFHSVFYYFEAFAYSQIVLFFRYNTNLT